MRRLALAALLPAVAFAQGALPAGVSPVSVSSTTGTFTTLNATTGNITNVLSPGLLTLKGQPTDGAAAVAVVIDSVSLANGTAKLVSFREAGTEYAHVKADRTWSISTAISSSAQILTSAEIVGQSYVQVHLALYNPSSNNGGAVAVDDAFGFMVKPWASLQTCVAALEGSHMTVAAVGGVRTRSCMCVSDGAGSPAFAWMEEASGNLGTTTTCGTP